MAAVLLVLFPLLLMISTRAAWVALAAAIVMLYTQRSGGTRRAHRRPTESDASI